MKKEKPMITQRQRKYLCDRLDQLRRSKPSHYEPYKEEEPVLVKAARGQIEKYTAVVDKWEDKLSEKRKLRNQAIELAVSNCRRLIEFGDAEKALKALDQFEAKEF